MVGDRVIEIGKIGFGPGPEARTLFAADFRARGVTVAQPFEDFDRGNVLPSVGKRIVHALPRLPTAWLPHFHAVSVSLQEETT
jgi:hypothetical protein